MKENPSNLSQFKVNFRYTNSPTRKSPSFDGKQLVNINLAPNPPLFKEVHIHRIANSEFGSSKTSQSAMNTQQTLKKQGFSLEVVTLRKEGKQIDPPQLNEQTDTVSIDMYSQSNTFRANEISLLKEEIKYMRKKLIEAQNSQKSLKLEFELYQASTEAIQSFSHLSNHKQKDEQKQFLFEQLKAKENKILQQQKEIANMQLIVADERKQSTLLQKQIKQKMEQNKQLTMQTRQMYNEIQMRCHDLDHLNQEYINVCYNNQLFFNQNNLLKQTLKNKQSQIASHQMNIFQLREKCLHFQHKAYTLQAEIQKMAEKINQIRLTSESSLNKLDSSLQQAGHFQQKLNELQYLKQKIENESRFDSKEHTQQKNLLQCQNYRLKSENIVFQSNLSTLLSNERIMLNEIQWLRNELSAQANKYQFEFKELQQRHRNEIQLNEKHNFEIQFKKDQHIIELQGEIKRLSDDREQMAVRFEQNINNIMQIHERQIVSYKKIYEDENANKLRQSQNKSTIKIEGQNLSSQELIQHLQLIKNQPEPPQIIDQFEIIRQENQILKQAIESCKQNHEMQMKHLRQRYQMQISNNNEEYTHQLHIYMKQVQILMQQMDKMKEKKNYCNDIIQQQAEECEYDDEKVKNDLRLYGQDCSQIYTSPPNNTPIKNQDLNNEEDIQINPQFMLNQIIDIDSKINSYIANFNKMRQQEQANLEYRNIVNDL